MKEVTIDNVRERIARIEECANRMPGGLRLSMNTEFELACLRQLLAAMDSEPVAYIPRSQLNLLKNRAIVEADLSKVQRFDEIPLYRHAQPAPQKYNIGEATMLHIFTATGMTDVSDMQAVFDQVEKALVKLERKPKVIEPDGWRDMMTRMANGLELMTSLASERAISVDTCVCLEWVRDARAMLDQEQPAPVVNNVLPVADSKELTAEQLQSIINDDWLLMDDCEGMQNCAEVKTLARMALRSDINDYLCDSAYVSGMQAGWNFGVVEDSAGFQSSLEHYRKGMREYRSALRNQAQEPATDNTAQQFEALATSAGSGKP